MCRYTGHKDGVWDVAVSRLGLPVVGTVSADHTAKVTIAERLASPLVRAPYLLLIRGRIQRKTWCISMGPYAGVDYTVCILYNLTLCPLQSRLQYIYHGQPYARDDLNPMPESTLSPSQGLWIWPQEDMSLNARWDRPRCAMKLKAGDRWG
jgi:hypothetical protein